MWCGLDKTSVPDKYTKKKRPSKDGHSLLGSEKETSNAAPQERRANGVSLKGLVRVYYSGKRSITRSYISTNSGLLMSK